MTETLPELIHRLVQDKGRGWVEREIGYGPDVIDQHLSDFALARARQAPRNGSAAPPDQVSAEPLRLTDLAFHLGVRDDTLSRALRHDPAAPPPVPPSQPGPDRWYYADVHAWWPSRRRRGERGPARPTAPDTPAVPKGEGQ